MGHMDALRKLEDNLTSGVPFEAVTSGWHAQVRKYSESVHAYHLAMRRRMRRPQPTGTPHSWSATSRRSLTPETSAVMSVMPNRADLFQVTQTAPEQSSTPSLARLTRRQLQVANLIAE